MHDKIPKYADGGFACFAEAVFMWIIGTIGSSLSESSGVQKLPHSSGQKTRHAWALCSFSANGGTKLSAEGLTPFYGPAEVNTTIPSNTLPLAAKPYGDFGLMEVRWGRQRIPLVL